MDVDFATPHGAPALQADGQPDRAAADRAGHHAGAGRRGERRAFQHVQHAGRGAADRDAQHQPAAGRRLKDTAANIVANREFVVHLTDEPWRSRCTAAATACRAHQSELDAVGLHALRLRAPWRRRASRRRRSPSNARCGNCWRPRAGRSSSARFCGCTRAKAWSTPSTWRVRLQDYHPVARFGASFYVRTRDRFAIGNELESTPSTATAIDEI